MVLLTIWLALEFDFLWLVVPLAWLAFWRLELFTLSGDMRLETTKSSATVREEFTGPTMPIFALNRHMADETRDVERGFEWETSGWRSTSTGRIEADESEADDIRVRIVEDDDHVRTLDVAIDPHGELTRVTATFERPASPALVVLERLYRSIEARALAAQGYVVVADDTSIF